MVKMAGTQSGGCQGLWGGGNGEKLLMAGGGGVPLGRGECFGAR